MLVPCASRRLFPAFLLVAGLGLCAALGAHRSLLHRSPTGHPQEAPVLADWQVSDRVGRLRERGLALRAVPTSKSGPVDAGASLTETSRARAELSGLARSPKRIAGWKETVLCERRVPDEGDRAQFEGHGLQAGPFFLFGDPDLLQRIADALREGTHGRTWHF
jgi:hypothetical protein